MNRGISHTIGPDQNVLNSEVFSFQRFLSTKYTMWHLGQMKVVSLTQRCPYREIPLYI